MDVKRAAAAHGLWYPPDPSSYEICSIGGNLATNAGGLCCVKYGVTTDYVLGLDVVLADGRLLRLGGRQLKDAAGLSLLKLFVGSEGLLGVITGATLRPIPAPPPPATLVATFPTVTQAANAVVAMGASTRASMMELMDRCPSTRSRTSRRWVWTAVPVPSLGGTITGEHGWAASRRSHCRHSSLRTSWT